MRDSGSKPSHWRENYKGTTSVVGPQVIYSFGNLLSNFLHRNLVCSSAGPSVCCLALRFAVHLRLHGVPMCQARVGRLSLKYIAIETGYAADLGTGTSNTKLPFSVLEETGFPLQG